MTADTDADLVLEYELDAPPERVWRAINTAEIRRRWLPDEDLGEPLPIATIPEREVRFRLRESLPPFIESEVSFQVAPDGSGGTRLRIVHDMSRARRRGRPDPVNGNAMRLHRAA